MRSLWERKCTTVRTRSVYEIVNTGQFGLATVLSCHELTKWWVGKCAEDNRLGGISVYSLHLGELV